MDRAYIPAVPGTSGLTAGNVTWTTVQVVIVANTTPQALPSLVVQKALIKAPAANTGTVNIGSTATIQEEPLVQTMDYEISHSGPGVATNLSSWYINGTQGDVIFIKYYN